MHKYLTEFIGTFFLVFTIGLAGPMPMGALAIGATLMVMVYMGGHISGAHYNPAVSLAVFVRGKLGIYDCIIYMLTQVVAAVAASFVVWGVLGNVGQPRPSNHVDLIAALVVEALYTFALALVVLNVATAKKTEGNSFYGLAIGFTVVAAAFAGGGISGGAYNPAVAAGPMIVNGIVGTIIVDGVTPVGTFDFLWIYLVGPFTGAIVAGLTFRVQEAGANAP